MEKTWLCFSALVTCPNGKRMRNGSVKLRRNYSWERLLASPGGIDAVARKMRVKYCPFQGDQLDGIFPSILAQEIAPVDVSVKDAGFENKLRVVSVKGLFEIHVVDFSKVHELNDVAPLFEERLSIALIEPFRESLAFGLHGELTTTPPDSFPVSPPVDLSAGRVGIPGGRFSNKGATSVAP